MADNDGKYRVISIESSDLMKLKDDDIIDNLRDKSTISLFDTNMSKEQILEIKEKYGTKARFIIIEVNNDDMNFGPLSMELNREERLAAARDMIKKKKVSKLGCDGKPMNKRQLAKEKKQSYKR